MYQNVHKVLIRVLVGRVTQPSSETVFLPLVTFEFVVAE